MKKKNVSLLDSRIKKKKSLKTARVDKSVTKNKPLKNVSPRRVKLEVGRIIGTSRYSYIKNICTAAGRSAINDAKEKRLPITYVSNGDIIIEDADGTKKILGHIKPDVKVRRRFYTLTGINQ
jgi:hypothetical protein